jgi:PAS domain S-box-containing protein
MSGDTSALALRAAMRAISEGVIVWSMPEGRIVTCNDAAASILGETRAAIEGRTLDFAWRLAREDGTPLPREERGAFLAVTTGKSQSPHIIRVERPDGTWAWVRTSSAVLHDVSGTLNAVVTTFLDVSELRQAGIELKQMADRLHEAMTGANVGTWELNLESGNVVRNARWAEVLGLMPADIEPTLAAFIDRMHPDDRDAAVALLEAGFRDGAPFLLECRARHSDGHWRWVQARGRVAEWRADGQARRVAGVLVDVHERRQTEETLRLALADNQRLIAELEAALANVRTLEGLLPICMYCKAIRDDVGAWSSVESYVTRRAKVLFSHGICPSCHTKHFPNDGEA